VKIKLIFEYNGQHVHPHPDMSSEKRTEWRQFFSKKTADEVERDDEFKNKFPEKSGWKVVVLWQKDDDTNATTVRRTIQERLQDFQRRGLLETP
jgi:G:T-mismatch repair DNA endonuclease (very short patch repair protein)